MRRRKQFYLLRDHGVNGVGRAELVAAHVIPGFGLAHASTGEHAEQRLGTGVDLATNLARLTRAHVAQTRINRTRDAARLHAATNLRQLTEERLRQTEPTSDLGVDLLAGATGNRPQSIVWIFWIYPAIAGRRIVTVTGFALVFRVGGAAGLVPQNAI